MKIIDLQARIGNIIGVDNELIQFKQIQEQKTYFSSTDAINMHKRETTTNEREEDWRMDAHHTHCSSLKRTR